MLRNQRSANAKGRFWPRSVIFAEVSTSVAFGAKRTLVPNPDRKSVKPILFSLWRRHIREPQPPIWGPGIARSREFCYTFFQSPSRKFGAAMTQLAGNPRSRERAAGALESALSDFETEQKRSGADHSKNPWLRLKATSSRTAATLRVPFVGNSRLSARQGVRKEPKSRRQSGPSSATCSLKALDPDRPIREATEMLRCREQTICAMSCREQVQQKFAIGGPRLQYRT